jgi:type IV secretion system protein TrbL
MQMNSPKFKYAMLLAVGLLISNTASAANSPVPSLMTQWETITTSFGTVMVDQGVKLLFILLGLQITLNGLNALRKGHEMTQVVSTFLGTLVTSTFFFAMISLSPTWFPKIIDSWNQLGGAATKTGPLNPGAIFALGLDIVDSIRGVVNKHSGQSPADFLSSIALSIQVVFVETFILLSFLVLAGQLALALIKGYLWLCLGPILLGFGGLSYTKDIAINTLKSAISIGVTILTCYVIAGVAINSVDIFNQQIASFTLDNWVGLWNCVGVAGLIALASWQVPKIANDFINGSVSGGVGETMAQGAVAAAGAAAVTGGVGGMLATAGKGAVDNLAGIISAGGSALNSASDLGKTGLDAVGHATSEMASHTGGIVGGSIRNMLDTSKANFSEGVNDTLGGKVAQSIEASRGGSISQSNGTSQPNAGASTSSLNENNSNRPAGNTAGGNVAGSSPGPGGELPQGGAMGSAETAALTGPGDKPDPIAEAVYQMAQQMSQKPSVADRIRGVGEYIPTESQSVSANVNLSQGSHHD